MTQPEKMELTSMDVAAQKREELKQALGNAFPEVFAEGSIDFDQLKRVLGEWVDPSKERFGLNWAGKAECMKVIQQPSIATLKPMHDDSVDFDETQNLFIEGDNLEVMKLLQKAYFGKIKMIYIDPPYNTGEEFIYPDNFSEGIDTYLSYTGQSDEYGRKLSTNSETDGRFHSKWLNMMYPRLYIAKSLLADDGVIFVSIDDNEQSNLRKVCDEIFGEDSFVACFIWEKRTNRENRKLVSSRSDYIVCYAKSSEGKAESISQLPMTDEALARYSNPDNDPRGPWKSDPATAQAGHGTKSQFYVFRAPNGREHHLESGRCWLYTEDVMQEAVRDKRIWLGKDGNNVPRVKTYLNAKDRGLTPETIWFADEASTNEAAKTYLKELFDGKAVFETPKPVPLLEIMVKIGAPHGIILDFFAGSSGLAEAVMKRNMEDGGQRKFLMVQLPEETAAESEARKAGFSNIAEIGRDRIRRAGKILAERKSEQLDFKQSSKVDFGFRAFRLDRSNFRIWDGAADKFAVDGSQLELHVDHIDEASTPEDILYELLVKAGFELTTEVEKLEIAGSAVFSIEDGALLICLEKEITPALIDALAEANPLQVICLDEGFKGNDQLKANAVQTFRARAQAEESEIVFRTV